MVGKRMVLTVAENRSAIAGPGRWEAAAEPDKIRRVTSINDDMPYI